MHVTGQPSNWAQAALTSMPSWMPVEGTLRSSCVMFLIDPGSRKPTQSARDDTRASAGAGAGAVWLPLWPACMAHDVSPVPQKRGVAVCNALCHKCKSGLAAICLTQPMLKA